MYSRNRRDRKNAIHKEKLLLNNLIQAPEDILKLCKLEFKIYNFNLNHLPSLKKVDIKIYY